MIYLTIKQAESVMSEEGHNQFCYDMADSLYTAEEQNNEVPVFFDRMLLIRYGMDVNKAREMGTVKKIHGPTTRQVRQILMNELGFTRESVRELMRDVVTEESGKVISRMVSEYQIEKIVVRAVHEELKEGRGWGSRSKMVSAVEDIAKEKAREIFDDMYPTSEQG